MDWGRVAKQTQLWESLAPDAQRDFVTRLNQETGAEVAEINGYIQRRSIATSFMSTRVDDAAEEDGLKPGDMAGVWRLTERLGAGGMGAVYRAERADGLYDQAVALKVLRGGDAEVTARFERERQRLARLDHPGVSRIIDGGVTADGRAFMAMEFVDGETLDAYVASHNCGVAERIGLFIQLCRAVSHAHSKLILHRDLKPSNVLVDATGAVRLIDFGIAAMLETDEVIDHGPLTYAFAAPEQLLRQTLSVATDVFGLGALLHAILAGYPPQRTSDGGVNTASAISDRDVSAIVTRATALDPADRYSSATALATDLSAYLAHRPVNARQGGFWYHTIKHGQRAPVASGLAAAAIIAVSGGFISSIKFASDARTEAAQARVALDQTEKQLEFARALITGNSTYSTLILQEFSGDNDEFFTQKLLDFEREARDQRASDPFSAASVSYAIGRLFYLRRDFVNAEKVLGDWTMAAYGPEALLAGGEHLLALSIFDSGDRQRAIPILQRIATADKTAQIDRKGLQRETRGPLRHRVALSGGDRFKH